MISLKSGITQKLLNYFFLNPQKELYVNELARELSLDKRNLVKKIKELETEGILAGRSRGNLKLYSINGAYPLYQEYKQIMLKTLGLEARLRDIFKNIKDVDQAYLYGSYAGNNLQAHSDIDILVVGRHSLLTVQKKINPLQKETGREINLVHMDPDDFKRRQKDRDPFLTGVLKGSQIRLK